MPDNIKNNKAFWAVIVIAVVLIVITLGQGRGLRELNLFGMFSASFDDNRSSGSLDELDAAERELKQAELEARIQELNARLDQAEKTRSQGTNVIQVEQADIGVGPGQQSVEVDLSGGFVNVSGEWGTAEGITYVLAQTGNFVTFEEYSPLIGLDAIGTGTIEGNTISISFQSVFGGFGTGTLQVSPDGNQISGAFVDVATGFSVPVTMFR